MELAGSFRCMDGCISLGHAVSPPTPPRWKFLPLAPTRQGGDRVLIKDALKIGHWHLSDGSTWHVTQATLAQIARTFRQMKARPWLTFSHGDHRGRVPMHEHITPIVDVQHQAGVLWIAVRAADGLARRLLNPAMKVSVGVSEFAVEQGRRLPQAMLHTAITDLPVVTGQGPFVELTRRGRLAVA